MSKSVPANERAPSTTQQYACYQTLRQWVTVGHFLPGERLKIRAGRRNAGRTVRADGRGAESRRRPGLSGGE